MSCTPCTINSIDGGAMREKQVEQKLVQAVKARGGICPKFVSPGFDGMPDRIVLLPASAGKAFWICGGQGTWEDAKAAAGIQAQTYGETWIFGVCT